MYFNDNILFHIERDFTMANISVKDILNSVCGKQENSNLPRCITNISTGVYLQEDDTTKEFSEVDAIKPVITLERHDKYVVCDIEYISAFDQDLREMYNAFTVFGSNLNESGTVEYEEGKYKLPYLIVRLTALQGYDHIVTLTNPIFWALTSNKPGSTPNTIRALFNAEDVLFFEGELLDEAKKVEEELSSRKLHEDMDSAYYEQREEETRRNNQ